jgi:acyl-coenzyme A thioesterase PaaI-like protein
VIGNAIRASLADHPDPLTISAYYLAPAVPGPAEITVSIKRTGRTAATVAAELSQGGEVRLSTLATYGDLAALPDGPTPLQVPAIDLPPLEECVSNDLAPPEFKKVAPLLERFDMRFPPADVGFLAGAPTGRGELSCWLRLNDDREPDPISLLFAVDALPPVAGDLGMPGWAPTLELTAYVRAMPAPGWLRVRHRTRHVAGGQFEEDCEVWDSAGQLVAQSRQLARLPRG